MMMKSNNYKSFQAHKLKIARNFHGLSLEEVGMRVAASRQYIQQLESAAKMPSGEMISALADALDFEKDFFMSPDLVLSSEEECHFRSVQTKTVSLKYQALSQATLLEKLVDELEEIINFPPINIPTPINISGGLINTVSEIEAIAEKTRLAWGLGASGPITNMVRAAESAGIVVGYFKGLSEKIDAFSKHGRRPIIIRNPLKESVCRMRFDIAHECGHLIMHQGQVTGDKQTESEANRFASAFLLPRAAFVSEFPRSDFRFNWSEIHAMKLRWKVSISAIVRRAFDLELIDAAAYRRASIHLSKTGQSKKEPYDDDHNLIPLENPQLLDDALGVLEKNAPHMINEISNRMMIKHKILEELVGRSIQSGSGAYNNVVVIDW